MWPWLVHFDLHFQASCWHHSWAPPPLQACPHQLLVFLPRQFQKEVIHPHQSHPAWWSLQVKKLLVIAQVQSPFCHLWVLLCLCLPWQPQAWLCNRLWFPCLLLKVFCPILCNHPLQAWIISVNFCDWSKASLCLKSHFYWSGSPYICELVLPQNGGRLRYVTFWCGRRLWKSIRWSCVQLIQTGAPA